MITNIGIFLRKLRQEGKETLKSMAEKLEVSSAFLSAVEHGKKKMPNSWLHKLSILYNLNDAQFKSMVKAAVESSSTIKINVPNIPPAVRNIITILAPYSSDANKTLADDGINCLINFIANMSTTEDMALPTKNQQEKHKTTLISNKKHLGGYIMKHEKLAKKYIEEHSDSIVLLTIIEQEHIKNINDYEISYSYYALEGEYKDIDMSLSVFLWNFDLLENDTLIMSSYENNKNFYHSLLSFLFEDWCPQKECLGGDPVFY